MTDGSIDETAGEPTSGVQSVLETWRRLRNTEAGVLGVTAVVLALFPWLLSRAPVVSDVLNGYQGLATLILIWTIFAIGFDLLLGYTGLLSFGHAAFWGSAAYAAANVSAYVTGSPIVVVVGGTAAAILLAWVLGFLSLRRGGIYFAILTLAFAQMLYFMAASLLATWPGTNVPLTRGEDGFTQVDIGPLFGVFDLYRDMPLVFGELFGTWLYFVVAALTLVAVAAAYRILNSPYGIVFRAIRENELRAEFVGFNVWRYKLMAFIISGAFAGVAGSLFTIHGRYVPLESLYWTTSGEIVIMVVLGGTGTLFGPMLGAAVYLYVENIVSGVSQLTVPLSKMLLGEPIVLISGFGAYWHLLLGIVFVAVIWLYPRGIWGLISDLRAAVSRRLGGDR